VVLTWNLYGPDTTTITSEQAKAEGGFWRDSHGEVVAELKFVTVTGKHIRVTGQMADEMVRHDVMLVGGGYVYLKYETLTQHSRSGAILGRYHKVIAWRDLTEEEVSKISW
jgi:hypothetical protein